MNVVCVDSSGKPVPAAEVHLFQRVGEEQGRYVHIGPLKADEQGKAVGPLAVFSNEHGNFDRWFYARVPGRLVGVALGKMDEPGRDQPGRASRALPLAVDRGARDRAHGV